MTWKELKDKISRMTEKKLQQQIPAGGDILALADAAQADIKDRVVVFEDALNLLGENHPLVKELHCVIKNNFFFYKSTYAYCQLKIIASALNELESDACKVNGRRYYPVFSILRSPIYPSSGSSRCTLPSDGSPTVFYLNYDTVGENICLDFNLAFKSKELAEYAGKHFIEIYSRFIL